MKKQWRNFITTVEDYFGPKVVIKKKIIINGVDIDPLSDEGKRINTELNKLFEELDVKIKKIFKVI